MNVLVEEKVISESICGANFSYTLNDNSLFLPTEYKVLLSQKDSCFVRCMKMLWNGKVQLYYFSEGYKSLTSLIPVLSPDNFLTIVNNLLSNIVNVHSNGFLTCKNIDASFDRIYVDPSTYKVSLVYLPLNQHLHENDAFENEIRTSLIKLISNSPSLSSPRTMQLVSGLQNGSFNLEILYSKLNGNTIIQQNHDNCSAAKQSNETQAPQQSSYSRSPSLRLVVMNASIRFSLNITGNEFRIGKKETNDGVISFNKLISRVHCKITKSNDQFFLTDLNSANGTFINHNRLTPGQPRVLKNGDVVRLANSDFQAVIS